MEVRRATSSVGHRYVMMISQSHLLSVYFQLKHSVWIYGQADRLDWEDPSSLFIAGLQAGDAPEHHRLGRAQKAGSFSSSQ